ncbi:hypothetical protein A8C32_00805 [Flavivirga aquatica]|uniref:Glycosyltransferase 2-like domain-containing protein n=1 Tax=Flavivirga aquatica TaxID=1849968 RepID=A0A1E5TBW4_9FLAO|nr:glycosyltransferase family 2 protein [Flavivirga aquatica]OEK08848.1 hypothetical protein A8C32_00805 [Flavivirga aquatica]
MISIIIPIYNREHLIEETLQSIIDQTNTNWECIIVDDGSTDNTIEVTKRIIKNDTRFKLLKRPSHIIKGPSACRNLAITKVKGSYIQFFDSDDVMHKDHLKLKREAIKNNDLVVCKLKSFAGAFNANLFIEKDLTSNILPSKNIFEDFVCGTFPMMMVAPLWKTESLKPYLPIREDLHILEDHELYARALFETKKVAIINQSLIFYRVGETSSINQFYSEVALAERNFESAKKCLNFINAEHLCYNLKLKRKYFRISFFYSIFRIVKKGDTKFKPLFKL